MFLLSSLTMDSTFPGPTAPAAVAPMSTSVEQAFLRRYMDDNAALFRKHLPLGSLVMISFGAWDYLLSPELAPTTMLVRLGVVFYHVLAYVSSWQSWFTKAHDWVLSIGIVLTGVAVAWILYYLPEGFVLGIAGVGLCIMAVSGFFRLPTRFMIGSCFAITVPTIGLMVLDGVSQVVFLSNTAFLIGFCWYGVISSWRYDRDSRALIAEKHRSDTLVQEVSSLRQERLTWLESLAHFLRHELKNQVVAVNTSLDLMERPAPDAEPRRYVGRARKSLGRIERLLRSATEATDLEAALSLESLERVDLSAVVRERLVVVREMRPLQAFRSGIQPGIHIEGSEDRLAQLIDKLLNNAVEHAADCSEILVMLTRVGSEAVLTVENEGDPLPTPAESLFEPFVTVGKAGGDGENVGLGLYVAKVIAEAHGGTIRAEAPRGTRGALFQVRFHAA